MLVTEVSVVIHEKRNHPYEYGHRDAEVRLAAQLTPYESIDAVIDELHVKARSHVEKELDSWLKEIEYDRRVSAFLNSVRADINQLRWCRSHAEMDQAYSKIHSALTESDYTTGSVLVELEQAKAHAAEAIAARGNLDEDEMGGF